MLKRRWSRRPFLLEFATSSRLTTRVLQGHGYSQQTIDDDMESLFYVVMYGCIRWLPHTGREKLGGWMYNFFDVADEDKRGRDFGGKEKFTVQAHRDREFLETFNFPNNRFIQDFFEIGYWYLATTHPYFVENREKKLWTMKGLRQLVHSIYGGLLKTDDTKHDRVENKVDDFFISGKKTQHRTHTPLTSMDETFDPTRGPLQLDSKGPSAETRKRRNHPKRTASPQTSGKRRRFYLDDQKSSFPNGESSTARVTRSAAKICGLNQRIVML
ncbi:hypothetical protein A7U60_g1304 [Sanghuangporus baumii]|uniref:Fungal-type protein kinase domain-containing protein n=1 Tax=Sanghuangporus baumii TaxID=108892 RepID=A0A9Q5NBS6_SANBA|nr:hypothetical protein A7U60_g1426 [Sanghuangporus baumii]OCB91426.1 hypothetical protein A7U60_g1304 [Sanghuangporus baumii]